MYSIYADGVCLYNDTYPMDEYKVSSPRLKIADSAAGSLEMVLPPTNICYDTLRRMKTTIIVKRYEDEIWEGRIVEDSYNFFNDRSVYCEGALAYFNDTCQPQREYADITHTDFLQNVIDVHNSKVTDNRKIYYDFQNVDAGVIDRRVTNYEKTLETLNNYCKDYSCHMRLVRRRVNIGTDEDPIYETRKFLQFFKGPVSTSIQTVEFGKNLLDYSANFNMSELATVVLPLGATKTRANSSGVGDSIDLTVQDPAGSFDYDKGYAVYQAITEETVLNTQEGLDGGGERILHNAGWFGYYTAVLKVKASTRTDTEDNKNTVYVSSRMHGGYGMYFWVTPTGEAIVSTKFSAEPTGFTDMIEESIEVPYATSEQSDKWYYLYVGSFGGDIQLRVNLKATVSDELDEYYTAEDALVSTVNLRSTIPTLENGNLSVDAASIGENTDDGNTRYLRSDSWFSGDGGASFSSGQYTLNATTSTDNVLQVRVFQVSTTTGNKEFTDWKTLPARFTIPDASVYATLKVVFKYTKANTDISASDITALSIAKGERYGSLYVTASSKNLFDDTIERGAMIDAGDLAGEALTSTSLTRLRSTKKLDILNSDGERIGFETGDYQISANVLKLDDTPTLQVRVYRYDFETEAFKSVGNWSELPMKFSVPQDESEKFRFEFRYIDDSNIGVTALSNIMLEQGSGLPSQYEPANTSLIEYGWIETCITWDDVVSPDELYYRAKTYLASGQFDHMTLDITALDLATLGINVDALDVNQYIRVISPPHGLDRYFEISELDIPLAEPENMTFKLGAETEQTLTGINNNVNNDLLKMIDEGPSKSAILKTAKEESDKIIKNGFANSYMTIILDDDDHPNGLGFFKAPVIDPITGDVDYEPTNDIPSAYWSNIYGNPTYNDIQSLLVNQEGIAFYGNGMNDVPTIALVNSKGEIVADAVKTGTMFADRIRGGTMALGNWKRVSPSGQTVTDPGTLYMYSDDSDQRLGDYYEMLRITKDDGVRQQGIAADNYPRSVSMSSGVLSGEIYINGSWESGGEILIGTYTQVQQPYGIEIRTPGILKLSTWQIDAVATTSINIAASDIYVMDSFGTSLQCVDDPVTFTVTDNQGVSHTLRLEFTHGLLTGFSVTP